MECAVARRLVRKLALAKDEEVEIVVQVNGSVRGKVKVAAGTGAGRSECQLGARQMRRIARASGQGRRIAKVIFVPDKLLNIVVE